tara:strand:- start:378 stop:557 length:180 start_codon:yes stop_codon:yes gene_type:complete
MEIIETVLGMVWVLVCVGVLGFGVSSYLHLLTRGDNNKIMDNIDKMERDEKKRKEGKTN